VAGTSDFLPFGPVEKEQFVRLLHRLSKFYTVRIVAYQVMSNHFHLVVQAPDQVPSPGEVCARYHAYHQGRRTLEPIDPRCIELGARMRDISWFMHDLQQQFACWYNRTRSERRRGSLWAERFKNTLLGDASAVWECCKYVELNPVRAGLVDNPADYRFSSYGAWCGKGVHPFRQNVEQVLLPWLEGRYGFTKIEHMRQAMEMVLAEMVGLPRGRTYDGSRFVVRVDRRVRYWTDGLIIGSELFVKDMIAQYASALRNRPKGLNRASGTDLQPLPLYCYKRLRLA
jgi:REP element-mobilizing transposase RayT